jgi:hypothetical protein
MYRLVILAIHHPKARKPDHEVKGHFEYDSSSQAELRALRWLMYCPDDIVMLLTPEDVYRLENE